MQYSTQAGIEFTIIRWRCYILRNVLRLSQTAAVVPKGLRATRHAVSDSSRYDGCVMLPK
jgi:hypothetical protein